MRKMQWGTIKAETAAIVQELAKTKSLPEIIASGVVSSSTIAIGLVLAKLIVEQAFWPAILACPVLYIILCTIKIITLCAKR